MPGPDTRRNFLRQLAGGALRKAPQLVTGGLLRDPLPPPRDRAEHETNPATMPTAPVSRDRLRVIAVDLGLSRVEDAIVDLARRSLRVTTAGHDHPSSSFSGGSPTLPGPVEALQEQHDGLKFVACIDTSEPASRSGSIWILHSRDETDLRPSVQGARIVVDADPPPSPPPGAHRLTVAEELTIPRPWSAEVVKLGLSEMETNAWCTMRNELAEAQGVPIGDSLPRSDALHRVFGYPDERRGDMPLACELAARGYELGSEPARSHPEAAAVEADATRWRLVLQLSRDDALSWRWGPSFERLYLWTGAGDVQPGEEIAVRALVQ